MDKKQLINKTLDMRYYKTSLAIYVLIAFLFLLFSVIALFSPDKYIVSSPIIVLFVVVIPSLIYYIYKIRSLINNADCYELYYAIATKSHWSFGRRGARYFELEVKDKDGRTFNLETKGVFTRSFLSPTYYKDYEQQEIQILYYRASGNVLVIDKTEL